jgi:hypothetical protein
MAFAAKINDHLGLGVETMNVTRLMVH